MRKLNNRIATILCISHRDSRNCAAYVIYYIPHREWENGWCDIMHRRDYSREKRGRKKAKKRFFSLQYTAVHILSLWWTVLCILNKCAHTLNNSTCLGDVCNGYVYRCEWEKVWWRICVRYSHFTIYSHAYNCMVHMNIFNESRCQRSPQANNNKSKLINALCARDWECECALALLCVRGLVNTITGSYFVTNRLSYDKKKDDGRVYTCIHNQCTDFVLYLPMWLNPVKCSNVERFVININL